MCKMPDILEVEVSLNLAATDAISELDRTLQTQLTFLSGIVESMLSKISTQSSASPVVSTPLKKRKLNTISEFEDADNHLKVLSTGGIPALNETFQHIDLVGSSTPKDLVTAPLNITDQLPIPSQKDDTLVLETTHVREKRTASKAATAMNSKLMKEKLNDKMRRPEAQSEPTDKTITLVKTPDPIVRVDTHESQPVNNITIQIESDIKQEKVPIIDSHSISTNKTVTEVPIEIAQQELPNGHMNSDVMNMPPPTMPIKVAKKKTVNARNTRSKKQKLEVANSSDTEDESNTSIQSNNCSVRSLRNRNVSSVAEDVTFSRKTRSTRNSERTNESLTLAPAKKTRGRKTKAEEKHIEEDDETNQRSKRCRTESDTETDTKKPQERAKRTKKIKQESEEPVIKSTLDSPTRLPDAEQNKTDTKVNAVALESSIGNLDVADRQLSNAVDPIESDKETLPSRKRSSSGKKKPKTQSDIAHQDVVTLGDQTFIVDSNTIAPKGKQVLNETVVIDKSDEEKQKSTPPVASALQTNNTPVENPTVSLTNEKPTGVASVPLDQTITLVPGALINYDPNCSLLTDDESEVEETPPRNVFSKTLKALKKMKEIFESPVKNHVQHFERLAERAACAPDNLDAPTRVTRTKTRAMAAKEDDGKENIEEQQKVILAPPAAKQMRSKIATPVSAKLITKHNLQSSIPIKPVMVHIQRTDPAEDAIRKRDQMLVARSEEQRRKREEKCRAAALAREAQEKLKQNQMERLEREREEKSRLLLLEREERSREEAEKKRLALEKKAAETEERRKQDEAIRQARLKEQEEEARRQQAQRLKQQVENEKLRKKNLADERELYAARKLQEQKNLAAAAKALGSKKTGSSSSSSGLSQKVTYKTFEELGTDDESESESQAKRSIPPWSRRQSRRNLCKIQAFVKPSIIEKFYSTTVFTPDLADIFPKIDRKKLVRTSSAVWKTPPRFSMMPTEDYNN